MDYWQGDDSREDPTVDNSVGVKPAQVRPEKSDGRKAVPGSGQLTSSEVTGEQTQQPERRGSAAENLPVPDDTGAAGRESQDGGGSPGLTEEDGTRRDEVAWYGGALWRGRGGGATRDGSRRADGNRGEGVYAYDVRA